ncbi:hypothetical protein IV417_03845 [Alphaproteobacteria bacterium KMM 3653]|uniref:EF-hand domain-containing protein n=1 Tax=Harenicola maris TaxID=2841044 RepID=A0AAP2CNS6_9RHOB|nr:hypothetical protein [Harenicola maris]
MKTLSLTLAGLTGTAALVLAMGAANAATDADGDGMLTFAEVSASHPEITEETFTALDTNTDGMLDADEVAAATEAGVLPAEG